MNKPMNADAMLSMSADISAIFGHDSDSDPVDSQVDFGTDSPRIRRHYKPFSKTIEGRDRRRTRRARIAQKTAWLRA